MITVAGVDGRRGGWVTAIVALPEEVNTASGAHGPAAELRSLSFHESLTDLLASDVAVIAIDMPIGLTDGPRACDLAARKTLAPHGTRVFPAPPRAALDHVEDYAAACAAARHVMGKALSRQTWNLLRSIRYVDQLADDPRLAECHPEVSFALMNGFPVDERKKTSAGREVRLQLLRRWLPDLADPLFGDDGLDALACAWSAARITAGLAVTLPAGDMPRDDHQRPMRITA